MVKHWKGNLADYYVLPLLGISSKDLDGFIVCTVNPLRLHIVVETQYDNEHLEEHPNYLDCQSKVRKLDGGLEEEYFEYKFTCPDEHRADLEYFIQGKYSKYSKAGKALVRDLSGLSTVKIGQGWQYDFLIVAIYHKAAGTAYDHFKKILEEKIGTKLPEEAELVAVPWPTEFKDY